MTLEELRDQVSRWHEPVRWSDADRWAEAFAIHMSPDKSKVQAEGFTADGLRLLELASRALQGGIDSVGAAIALIERLQATFDPESDWASSGYEIIKMDVTGLHQCAVFGEFVTHKVAAHGLIEAMLSALIIEEDEE